jgi:hypothetical protein
MDRINKRFELAARLDRVGITLPRIADEGIVRKAIELGDLGTADLSTEVSRGLGKWLWFAEAQLQAER